MSYADVESLQETLEILSDRDLVQEIREALADPERFGLDEIRRDLQARGQGPDE
jgi:antitoxin YefM